jgi:hypothetical protein
MARNDTAQFIRDVLRDAKVPAGSSYRTEATLLSLASDEMEQQVVPELLKVTGGHLMAYQDVALVSGKTRYRFPDRCIRPERLQIVDSSGKLLGKLHPASGELVDEVLAGRCPRGSAAGYWVAENNHAVLVLQNFELGSSGRLLRTYYRRQPNRLTTTSSCVKIISYAPPGVVAAQITFAKINAADTLATIVEEEPYDIIKSSPTFEASAEDCTFQSIVSPSMESLTGITASQDIEVGDFIAPAGFTPVPQLPVAFYGILVDYTVARILGPTDKAGAQTALDSAARKLNTALSTITPRGEEAETTANDIWM